MTKYINVPKKFEKLNLQIQTTRYSQAGDSVLIELDRYTPLNQNINIKTLLTRGSIRLEFPDSDTPARETTPRFAKVFPIESSVGKTKIKSIALEDNTEFQCIQPYPKYKIVYTDHNLSTNETLTINPGVILYVFGDSYDINGNSYSGFGLFAIENNIVIITATDTCRVVSFESVPETE
jgi:hypothetical protein